MNCVEFRRQLGIDPHCDANEFVRHRRECTRCAAAAERAAIFDRDLLRVLTIAAPSRLADSILLAQATQQNNHRARARRGFALALAAMLVLGVGVVGMHAQAAPLSVQAVEHLTRENKVLTLSAAVPAEQVRQAFEQRGITLRNVPANVSFVACCPLGKLRTVHLVMMAGDERITVIYIADKRVDSREDFVYAGWQGRSEPLGAGTLILLAKTAASFDHAEQVWRDAIVTQS